MTLAQESQGWLMLQSIDGKEYYEEQKRKGTDGMDDGSRL